MTADRTSRRAARKPRSRGAALLWRAVARRRRLVATGLGAALVYLGAFLAIPVVTARAVDEVILGGRDEHLPLYVGLLFAAAVVRAIAGALRKMSAGRLGAAIGADLRGEQYQHFQRMSFSFHDRIGAGQLMSRSSSDITAIEQVVVMLPYGTQSMLLGVGGAVLMAVLDPILAAAVVAVLVCFALPPLRMSPALHETSRDLQDYLGEYSEYVEQQIHGIEVVKGHGFELAHVQQGQDLMDHVHDTGVTLADLRATFGTLFGVGPAVAVLVVLGLGGWRGINGQLTPGELLAFVQYLGMLMAPVMVMSQMLALLPQGMAAADRIAEVLDSEPAIVSPAWPRPLPAGGGRIEFRSVDFGYRPGEQLLRGLWLTIEAGQSVAIVGPSGSGKSTLALLLGRFYEPDRGAVFLDGIDVRHLDLNALRNEVAMVFEDTVLFSATVRHNLAMARPQAPTADVLHAAQLSKADEFIRELPQGYDTRIGEDGVGLSGGQRQRLSIARAILRDPRVLILDDATSALDPDTDREIREGLQEIMKGRTTIVIAHRLETLALADRVVLLDEGRVIADGAHEDLLCQPAYRRALAIDDVAADQAGSRPSAAVVSDPS